VFNGLQPSASWLGRYRAVGVSVVLHLSLLAVIILHRPRVIDVTAAWLAWGNAGHSYKISYLPINDANVRSDEPKLFLPSSPASRQKSAPPRSRKPAIKPHHQLDAKAEEGPVDSKAGSPLGMVLDGPISGHEVRIALPVYPEPQVDRANLPRNLSGDVVIEVTIDAQGNVVETRIIQAIGNGIDEKIEATLRQRHYQPATVDGTPVASRQDVHFHFPS